MSAIRAITDDLLIAAIQRAENRLVMIAPGVSAPLAGAVAETWKRLGKDRVTVILDVDPEICRIGYGSLDGLELLQKAAAEIGEAIGQEPGVRICVFIIDDQTFVFSPTPRQLEAAPGEDATAGETSAQANGLVLSAPPPALQEALGAGPDGDGCRSLGLKTLKPERIQEVKKDLEQNPPKPFDLSRAVNVYNAKIQFVEFKVTGCRISQHKARLPKHLLHILKNNPALSENIENSIRLLDSEDDLVNDPALSQNTISKLREKIGSKFLRPVENVGAVIERSRKEEFEKEVEKLKGEVARFAEAVEDKLAERFKATAEDLGQEILAEVLANLPDAWKKQLGPDPNPARVKARIVADLLKAFGNPFTRVGRMKVDVVFKDVTYDMLKKEDFRAQIHQHFPNLPLMEEFSAAKERPPPEQPSLF